MDERSMSVASGVQAGRCGACNARGPSDLWRAASERRLPNIAARCKVRDVSERLKPSKFPGLQAADVP
jgi:hypothetical protein